MLISTVLRGQRQRVVVIARHVRYDGQAALRRDEGHWPRDVNFSQDSSANGTYVSSAVYHHSPRRALPDDVVTKKPFSLGSAGLEGSQDLTRHNGRSSAVFPNGGGIIWPEDNSSDHLGVWKSILPREELRPMDAVTEPSRVRTFATDDVLLPRSPKPREFSHTPKTSRFQPSPRRLDSNKFLAVFGADELPSADASKDPERPNTRMNGHLSRDVGRKHNRRRADRFSTTEWANMRHRRLQRTDNPVAVAVARLEEARRPDVSSKAKQLIDQQKRRARRPKVERVEKTLLIPMRPTVRSLSALFGRKIDELLHCLRQLGYKRKSASSPVKQDVAELLAVDCDVAYSLEPPSVQDVYRRLDEDVSSFPKRPPVVCVMGHVDHGKTTLIDCIRQTSVAAMEHGGITQSIGAFQVPVPNTNPGYLTIFDTPGHSAFSSMRERGASMVDIVVLVVAGDEGVKEQTIESMRMASKAGATVVVAVSKSDLGNFNRAAVCDQLSRYGIFTTDLGGDVKVVSLSSITGDGVEELLQEVWCVGQTLECRADPEGSAEGVVVETRVDAKSGVVANVLVQRGSLQQGDCFVVGTEWGRVKRLRDHDGNNVARAPPSKPISVFGLNGPASVGAELLVVKDEKTARSVAEFRHEMKQRDAMLRTKRWQIEDKFAAKAKQSHLPLVIKGDVLGSLEAITQFVSLIRAPGNEVTVSVASSGIGRITEGDVDRAKSIGAMLVGFGVDVSDQAQRDAKQLGVDIRQHNVIFELMDDVVNEMTERLPVRRETEVLGTGTVLKTFELSRRNDAGVKPVIAGCRVNSGSFVKQSHFRVLRDDITIFESPSATSLRHHKDIVEEIPIGKECGLDLGLFTAYEQGDVVECYEQVVVERRVDIPVIASDAHPVNEFGYIDPQLFGNAHMRA